VRKVFRLFSSFSLIFFLTIYCLDKRHAKNLGKGRKIDKETETTAGFQTVARKQITGSGLQVM
jgi:hypothetical protein